MVVGGGTSTLGDEAFLWTSAGGMQNLGELLLSGGATGLTGWRLNIANAVSADGRTIVGYGTNPAGNQEAWAATIPEPNTLTLVTLASFALLAHWGRRRWRSSMRFCNEATVSAEPFIQAPSAS